MTAALHAGLWDHGSDLLLAVAADGSVAAANPAWSALLGLDPARLSGQQLQALLHPDDGAACSAALSRARGGARQRFEARVRDHGGSHHDCDWTAAAVDGTVFAIGRERAEPSADATLAASRTRRSLAMGRLAGGVAHDFNNLLQALRNVLELIRLKPADAPGVLNWAEHGLRIVERGGRLTAQLLAASGARRDEAVRAVPVLPLLHSLAARLRQIVTPDVAVLVAADAAPGSVLADPRQLEGSLLNLALNAGEAMPRGGSVTLGSRRLALQRDSELPSGDYLCLEVADTGAGMSDAVRERAFEPFFTTKPIGSGSGLGLAQVHGFARRHGGSVRIAASSGAGTALHLMLPALATAQALPTHERVVVSAGDDTGRCCESLRQLGWDATPASDAAAALAAARSGGVAVLVLTAGDAADAALRELQAERPGVGIVLLGGADLPRPVQPSSLAAAVERAAR